MGVSFLKRLIWLCIVLALVAGTMSVSQSAEAVACSKSIKSLTLKTSIVVSGNSTVGTVKLRCAAKSAVRVKIRGFAGVKVPARVKIKSGKKSAQFTIRAASTIAARQGTVRVMLGGTTKSTRLRVIPKLAQPVEPQLSGLTLVMGGLLSQFDVSVRLSSKARAGGAQVALTSDNPLVVVPRFLGIPEGATSVSREAVIVGRPEVDTPVTITASLGGVTLRETYLLLAAFRDGDPFYFVLNDSSPPPLHGSERGWAVIIGLGPRAAPAGGLPTSVSVVGDDPAVVLSDPEGAIAEGSGNTWVDFSTAGVTSTRHVTLEALVGNQTRHLDLTIHPQLMSVNLPTSVASGSTVTGTVTLAGPADEDLVVLLGTQNGVVTTPSSVTIPAGQVTAQFTATTGSVSTVTYVQVNASLGKARLETNPMELRPDP